MKPRCLPALILASALIGLPIGAAEHSTLEIGASAPDFTLPGVDGKMHSLKDYAESKFLTIIFT
jgi:hypothetical protein